MRIIQSFWSGQNNDVRDHRGWLSYEYHWLGWILSCNQLRKFYDEVELYTDSLGYEILIEKLKLPYTKVHVVLDDMNQYPKDLWAIAKIKTYELQDKPFLHVDGDVFIWAQFPKELIGSSLIAQNLENTTDYYREMWNNIAPHLDFIPDEIHNYHNVISNLGCNMGIVGGTDIKFFQEYTRKSFEFVDKNKATWKEFNLFNFNIFFEQELFYEMAMLHKKSISYLFDEVWGDNSYLGLGNFQDVPHKRYYLHLLGNFKRRLSICRFLEAYVTKEYSEDFMRLKNFLPEKYDVFDYKIPQFSFSEKSNNELIENLRSEIFENRLELNNRNLLARNLFILSLFEKFDDVIKNKADILLVLLNCFEIDKDDDIENIGNQNLKVREYDDSYIAYDFDDIDLLILKELQKPILLSQFLEYMKNHLDDSVSENELNDFNSLIINRLKYFLECKILLIFEKTNS